MVSLQPYFSIDYHIFAVILLKSSKMPLYDYSCPECGAQKEVEHSMSEVGKIEIICVECSHSMKKKLSMPSLIGFDDVGRSGRKDDTENKEVSKKDTAKTESKKDSASKKESKSTSSAKKEKAA